MQAQYCVNGLASIPHTEGMITVCTRTNSMAPQHGVHTQYYTLYMYIHMHSCIAVISMYIYICADHKGCSSQATLTTLQMNFPKISSQSRLAKSTPTSLVGEIGSIPC